MTIPLRWCEKIVAYSYYSSIIIIYILLYCYSIMVFSGFTGFIKLFGMILKFWQIIMNSKFYHEFNF